MGLFVLVQKALLKLLQEAIRHVHRSARTHGRSNGKLEQSVAREELKWQNIDADDLPAEEILRRDG